MGKNNEKNRIIIIIVVLIAILTLLGGTLAFWSWQTGNDDKTNVVFTLTSTFWCAADGGGSISSATLMPASCTNETYAIQREVKLTSSIEAADININMDLWLNIDQIGDGLSQSEHFKYALTTNPNSCTEGVVKSGTFHNLEANDKAMLLEQKEYGSSMEDTLYLYIWIDPEETNHMIVDQTFSFSLGGECTQKGLYNDSILNGADPELATGMIPVTISNTGVVTTADVTSEWYNYEDKEWANVVLVTDASRSNYYESDGETIKSNQVIPESDILAYYVWIPKYSYKMNGTREAISISFNNTPSGYIEHPAFDFDGEISGFWVGKFEPSHLSLSADNTLTCTNDNCVLSDGLRIKPNVTPKSRDKIAYKFYSSRSIERDGNPFGLVSKNVDTHMMKNIEWGAVTYLSYSIYGINDVVRTNNSYTYTGCGASSPGAAYVSGCQITYGAVSSGEYPQSTTGNISGIFDMSGGLSESVMAYYTRANDNYQNDPDSYFGYYSDGDGAGFSFRVNSKYWDDFYFIDVNNMISGLTCNGGECYGFGMFETYGWYTGITYASETQPWYSRGGSWLEQSEVGLFRNSSHPGGAVLHDSFRVSLVVNDSCKVYFEPEGLFDRSHWDVFSLDLTGESSFVLPSSNSGNADGEIIWALESDGCPTSLGGPGTTITLGDEVSCGDTLYEYYSSSLPILCK